MLAVHLGELTLKGKNRRDFEQQLIRNIRAVLPAAKLTNIHSQFIVEAEDENAAVEQLRKVFGISWISRAVEMPRDIKKIAAGIAKRLGSEPVKIETRRHDKSFPRTSIQISQEIAELLHEKGKNPSVREYKRLLLVEIFKDKSLVSFERINGLGGLPQGSSGKLLCLFSGGIDSPVASWLMMGRGCLVDLLHVHPAASNDLVKKSKIAKLTKQLSSYAATPLKLYLAPYDEFYRHSAQLPPREEAVLFRRFLLYLANALAEKNGYQGVITGDSVGQVASQTLANLAAIQSASSIPIYRPVVGMDKEGIIKIAKSIGTYEESIKPYKDCCSLVSQGNPTTKAKEERLRAVEKTIDMAAVVRKTLDKTEAVFIPELKKQKKSSL
ncbi:MAG: tRNA uracil 4-sulfurtransferase ThiI [Candidatus Micrarchaeota archaeon]